MGYLFHIGAALGTSGGFAFERIEDAIVQADEVGSKYLQFEGGLSITGNWFDFANIYAYTLITNYVHFIARK